MKTAATWLLAALCCSGALAHDSWFERRADGSLALGTGLQFPKQDTSIDPAYLAQQGCDAAGCWAQTTTFELDLAADKIALYLDEVRPPQAVVDAWQSMRARGLPWHERYAKHARIVLDPGAAAVPSGMAMDVLFDGHGREKVFQVLRDGRPLPDFAVELRSDRSRFGIWRRTDADGRLRFTPPFAGQWLLRGVDLRVVDDHFDSRFITLAFEVRTAAP